MNFSKKHLRHRKYLRNYYFDNNPEYTTRFIHYMRSKKSRAAKRIFRKAIISGIWQERVFEQTGIRLK